MENKFIKKENLNITTKEITDSHDPKLLAGFELLKERLPENEIVSFEIIKSVIDNQKSLLPDNYHFLINVEKDKVLAVTSGYYISSENIGFINYLVTKSGLEKQGIGSKIREKLIELFKKDVQNSNNKQLRGIVGEVEKDNPWLKKLSERGALVLDIDYIQPSLHNDSLSPHLALYFQSIEEKVKELKAKDIESLIYKIYKDVYDIDEPEKSLDYQEILKSIKKD